MLDEYSDASEFGGLSQQDMRLVTEHDQRFRKISLGLRRLVRLRGRLRKEPHNLTQVDHMFVGFKCLDLIKQSFENFNGVRITMKPPAHPCKVGLHVQTSFKEFELFVVRKAGLKEAGPHSGHSGTRKAGVLGLRGAFEVDGQRQGDA